MIANMAVYLGFSLHAAFSTIMSGHSRDVLTIRHRVSDHHHLVAEVPWFGRSESSKHFSQEVGPPVISPYNNFSKETRKPLSTLRRCYYCHNIGGCGLHACYAKRSFSLLVSQWWPVAHPAGLVPRAAAAHIPSCNAILVIFPCVLFSFSQQLCTKLSSDSTLNEATSLATWDAIDGVEWVETPLAPYVFLSSIDDGTHEQHFGLVVSLIWMELFISM